MRLGYLKSEGCVIRGMAQRAFNTKARRGEKSLSTKHTNEICGCGSVVALNRNQANTRGTFPSLRTYLGSGPSHEGVADISPGTSLVCGGRSDRASCPLDAHHPLSPIDGPAPLQPTRCAPSALILPPEFPQPKPLRMHESQYTRVNNGDCGSASVLIAILSSIHPLRSCLLRKRCRSRKRRWPAIRVCGWRLSWKMDPWRDRRSGQSLGNSSCR